MVVTPAQLADVVKQINASYAALAQRVEALEAAKQPAKRKPAAKKVEEKA